MIKWRSNIVVRRAWGITAGLMLALAGLAGLPASHASASSSVVSVVSWWGTTGSHYEDSGGGYSCSGTWRWPQGANPVLEVWNPCGDRVWVHYIDDSTGDVQSYCVNPGGGLAYDVSQFLRWDPSHTTTDIQLSGNTSPCNSTAGLTVIWRDGPTDTSESYYCGYTDSVDWSAHYIGAAFNTCDTRVWLHEFDSGTGNSYCIDNVNTGPYSIDLDPGGPFWQFTETLNQAPCDAGGPPYSY